ncbi:MAG: hypothetical protein ACREN0_11945, partial [Thermodesulfobacteriota bacterium]
MTKILPLVLDRQCSDLKLTNLSLKFEQGTRGRNFWFWYALFGDPKLSFAGIGRKAHVSRQRVYQIYKAWFAEIFPKRHMIIHRPKSYPLLGKARTLRDHLLKGQKAGLLSPTFKIQPVPRVKKGWSQSLLKLTRRGHPDLLCSCFVVSGIHQYGSPTIYARLETREKGISGTDFLLILHVGY